jgi:sugar lactone lactonase YvrE
MRYTINFTPLSCPVVEDGEPNDSRQTAHTITVGSSVRGVACPVNDQDFFKFRAEVGTILDVQVDTLRREPPFPSYGCACPIQAYVALLASDSTVLARTWFEEKAPHIRYEVTKADTYYVQAWIDVGGIRYAYTLHVRALDVRPPGPGDSVIVRANLGDRGASTIVAAPDGVLYTSDGYRIWRFDRNGNQTLFHFFGDFGYINDLAFDAFGNFLAATDRGVYRITPRATATRIVDTPTAKAIAVAPDGSLWVTFNDPGTRSPITHYNPVGRLLTTYDVASAGPVFHLAVGPSGDLYFSTLLEIYRLVAGNPQLVLRSAHPGREIEIGRFAFDADGNIYVPNLSEGTVTLYGPSGAVLTDPFSWWPENPSAVVFDRNADGTPNSRLFALDGVRLLELNPAGVRSRGLPLGRTTNITVAAAVKGLLRNAGLSDADRAFLAGLGNDNGRYDVGDLRAFLLATGELEGSVP